MLLSRLPTARERAEAYLATSYLNRYPGLTFGERKKDIFSRFKTVVDGYRVAQERLVDLPKLIAEEKALRKADAAAYPQKRDEATIEVYKSAVDAGLVRRPMIAGTPDIERAQAAIKEHAPLRAELRAKHAELKTDFDREQALSKARENFHARTVKGLRAGDGSVGRLFKAIAKTGIATAGAVLASAFEGNEKLAYKVKRGAHGLVLVNEKIADATANTIKGAARATASAVAGATHTVLAGTVNAVMNTKDLMAPSVRRPRMGT